jgi:hypothetical protein
MLWPLTVRAYGEFFILLLLLLLHVFMLLLHGERVW